MTTEIQNLIEKIREFEALHGDGRDADEMDLEEDPAEEIQHHTSCDFACILPGVIHSNRIPWYTAGFQ